MKSEAVSKNEELGDPSYSLSLDVGKTFDSDGYSANQISEEEFNK